MDDNLVKIAVGILAAIGGAIAAGLANAYVAKQKIREVELSYIYKLRDGYLENARKAVKDVYLPLSIALTELRNEYDTFRQKIDFDTKTADAAAKVSFRSVCEKYLMTVDDLMIRGADAYMTTELDERLQMFNNVLRESIGASSIVSKYILGYNIAILPMEINLPAFEFYPKSESILRRLASNISINVAGLSLTYKQEVLAAPLETREFERIILTSIPAIKFSIKEVVLGSR